MIVSETTVQLSKGGGAAFLVKHGLVVNKEYRNSYFNIITDNEALAIDLELSNNQNLTLATIYCTNGKPNLTFFQTINNLSDNVMFVRDFNSKLESFGCAKKNASDRMLKNIQKQLNLISLSNDKHMHMGRGNHSTDLSDMAFVSPNLAKHDIQFQTGDDLGSDHPLIEVSIKETHLLTTPGTNSIRPTEVFESTLKAAFRFRGPF